MWEWIRIVAHNVASIMGLREPAANGAIVKGMRAADIVLERASSQFAIQRLRGFFKTFQKSNGSFRASGSCSFLRSFHFLRYF